MFFKIGSIRNFAIFTTPALRSLFNTVADLKVCNFFKNRLQHRWFLRILQKFWNFFYDTSGGSCQVSWGACSLISCLHVFLILIRNFHKTLHKYLFTIVWQNNFFLVWIHWSSAFNFRMFGKNISCFRFWWKSYTKCCTCNYVISCVKRLSSPALCVWSGVFNFREWLGKRKNVVQEKILH